MLTNDIKGGNIIETARIKLKKKNRHIIDAVEDLSFPNQSKKYNDDYKKWKGTKKNPFVYQFTKNTKENIYIDGIGFIDQKPQVNEQKALGKNMLLLGFVMSGVYILSIVIKFLFLQSLNIQSYMSLWITDVEHKNSTLTQFTMMYCVIEVVVPLISIITLKYFLKLPSSVAFPPKSTNKPMSKISIPVLMAVIVVANFCSYFYFKILSLFGLEATQQAFNIPKNPWIFIFSAFIYIVIGSILYECLMHGVIMQSLRQFGDGFALLTVSAICTLITHNISTSCYVFILSIAIGFFVLRTGSVSTGIFMQIFARAFAYLIFILNTYLEFNIAHPVNVWIHLGFLLCGAIAILVSTRTNKSLVSFDFQKSFMSTKEKVFCSLTTPSILLWLVMTFLWSIIKINIRL